MEIYGLTFVLAGSAINTNKRKNGADFKINKEYKKAIGVVYLLTVSMLFIFILQIKLK